MRVWIRVVAVVMATAALGLPAVPASAAKKHCRNGYTLKHHRCVKSPKHSSATQQTPFY